MKSKFLTIGIVVILILLFVGGCRYAGQWLVKEDKPLKTDAIVILMGSISDRVLQTADLYSQKTTGKVLIVESGMGAYKALEARGVYIISNTNQVYQALVTLGIPADSIIILPGDATSTKMEAMIVRKHLLDNPGIDTLILVTSSDHTRRASMIFKAAFSKIEPPVTVLCSPNPYTGFDAEKWWKSRDGVEAVLWEYVKIGVFVGAERSGVKK